MAIELHLPDLPDVPISLGPQPAPGPGPRAPLPWRERAQSAVSAYLPLLLMLMLALGTWWLVKNTPLAEGPREAAAPRSEPDYVMQAFVVERFDKSGRLKLRIQGEQLRHYPDTERIEIDQAHIRAVASDGRATQAQARRALVNGDGSELQLLGDARVDGSGPRGEPIEFRGEFLHAFLNTERLRSHLPVWVRSEGSEFRAEGLDYDNLAGLLELKGRMRAVLMPATTGPAASSASAPAAR
jgi:lipopolysaccharide export system protein LptC